VFTVERIPDIPVHNFFSAGTGPHAFTLIKGGSCKAFAAMVKSVDAAMREELFVLCTYA
jgi:hypothetical protein